MQVTSVNVCVGCAFVQVLWLRKSQVIAAIYRRLGRCQLASFADLFLAAIERERRRGTLFLLLFFRHFIFKNLLIDISRKYFQKPNLLATPAERPAW